MNSAGRVLERAIGRLDDDFIVDDATDLCCRERRLDLRDVLAAGQVAIGEQGDARESELGGIVAGFAQHAGAERERRHAERESAVAAFEGGKVGVTASHRRSPLVRSDGARRIASVDARCSDARAGALRYCRPFSARRPESLPRLSRRS
jgi:hypothetical protein